MKRSKNVTWGIFFIVMAFFIIMGGLDAFGDFSVWTAIGAGFCVMWFINGLVRFSFGNMLFPVAFIAILFDETIGIEELTPWPVLFAALFLTIGLNMIFGNRKKRTVEVNGKHYVYNGSHGVDETTQSDERFDCDLAFGSTVKYVNCQNLKFANIENAFGSATIYFDNARLGDAQATVRVENSFGKTTLYIPKEWKVSVDVTKAFGSVTENGNAKGDSDNTLIIMGEVSFGNLEVNYV